jgi:hypothetical protein
MALMSAVTILSRPAESRTLHAGGTLVLCSVAVLKWSSDFLTHLSPLVSQLESYRR